MMANKEWCRHYTGTGNTDKCEAGVAYESVKDTTQRPYRYPCTGKCATTCAKFEHWTEAEIAETEQYVADFVKKSNDFASGESRVCPQCGTPVTGATLYAKWEPDMYSLYVQPCHCRLGLWGGAPQWIENVTIIPVQDDWIDDSDEMENADEASEPTFDPEAQEAGSTALTGIGGGTMSQKINVGDYVIWDDENYPYVVESVEDGIATLAEATHGNVVIREWVAVTELRKMTDIELEDWFGDEDTEESDDDLLNL